MLRYGAPCDAILYHATVCYSMLRFTFFSCILLVSFPISWPSAAVAAARIKAMVELSFHVPSVQVLHSKITSIHVFTICSPCRLLLQQSKLVVQIFKDKCQLRRNLCIVFVLREVRRLKETNDDTI